MTLTEFLLARIVEDKMACEAAGDDLEWIGGRLIPLRSRLLAECEAKRRIVAILVPEYDGVYGEPSYCMGLAEDVLKTLALPYADHPDYNPEWRP